MESSGAGQAPLLTICDGPLKFIRRRDNTDPIILVNESTRLVQYTGSLSPDPVTFSRLFFCKE
jgi:hypothetical protein